MLSFSIILPYLIVDLKLCNRTDDIMLAMAKSQKPYFKLNKENSKDHRDHYFMFNVEPSRDNNLVRLYCYDSTMTHISKNRPK
ncbi:DUF5960 family protein [Streptococcus suis]